MIDLVKKIYLVNIEKEIEFEYEIESLEIKDEKPFLAYFNLSDDELLAVHKQISVKNLIVIKLDKNNLDIGELKKLADFDLSVKKFYELEKIIRFMNTQKYNEDEQVKIRAIASSSYKLGLDVKEYESAIRVLKGLVKNEYDNKKNIS